MNALFSMDVGTCSLDEALASVRQEATETEAWNFVEEFITGVDRERETLDARLQELCDNWSWDRLARVDRNVLRMGAFELKHKPDTPVAIAINEAVELAKIYGDARSPQFVNGVLDAFRQGSR